MKNMSVISIVVLVLFFGCKKQSEESEGKQATAKNTTEVHTSSGPVIVYMDGGIKMVPNLGGAPIELMDGVDPEVSPDGKIVAFTMYTNEGFRKIGVYTIDGGTIRVLKSVIGENNYYPRWSPDGKRLLFNHFTGAMWLPAMVRLTDEGFKVIGEKTMKNIGSGLYSPCWGPNGESILCQDLDNLYHLDVSGNLLWKKSWDSIMGQYADSISMSSAVKMSLGADNKTLLIGCNDYEDMIGVAYTYDLETQQIQRVSPYKFHVTEPLWVPDRSAFLFSGTPITPQNIAELHDPNGALQLGVYSYDTVQNVVRQIILQGTAPSCSMSAPM